MALSAPTSAVAVCNLALSQLKEATRVTQLDPPTSATEETCALWYEQERMALLRQTTWSHSTTRIQLAPSATQPVFGSRKAFDLPDGFIRLVQIQQGEDDGFANFIRADFYSIEGNQILISNLISDSDIVNLRFIFDNKVVASWDPLFINLLAINLAIRMAPNFGTTAQRRMATLLELQDRLNREARAIDSQENPPRRIQRSRFNEARRRSGSNQTNHLINFDR